MIQSTDRDVQFFVLVVRLPVIKSDLTCHLKPHEFLLEDEEINVKHRANTDMQCNTDSSIII